ncbi:DNA repair protein RAD51 homolog 3-like isoform X2 [Corticium candelabrum]|nr:DNA repair protein RAD51 homolog 3-like isoform X2 [Corticium candelabrum]XP_062500286.1 DNA repair protein RAD51 homolog 3-like isoform X2 [Corticium candelabrum]XP_062500292.1 DNA repair protein RAD51 homolog 3-like isoform X2 [Corticium candelabrum]
MVEHLLHILQKSADSCEELKGIVESERELTTSQLTSKFQCSPIESATALDLFHTERSTRFIVTFGAAMDEMIGGGIPLGKITEFLGEPGCGKTQMCFQLAVDVTIPEEFGGVDGEAVYLDTEGTFVVDRVVDIAVAAHNHLENVAKLTRDNIQTEILSALSLKHMIAAIHYVRCLNHLELLFQVSLLPDFIQEHPKVKLIIIDSIAFPFRQECDDSNVKTRILSDLGQSLLHLASVHHLAVVLTNHVTTRFLQTEDKCLLPALGESWGHSCYNRLLLERTRGSRYATLLKSPYKQSLRVPFQLTADGVRDAPMQAQQEASQFRKENIGFERYSNKRK